MISSRKERLCLYKFLGIIIITADTCYQCSLSVILSAFVSSVKVVRNVFCSKQVGFKVNTGTQMILILMYVWE